MNFPKSRMYYSTDGSNDDQMSACRVIVRDDAMVVEYVDEMGNQVTYHALKIAEGHFEIRQELEKDDYLYTATLHRRAVDVYEGKWNERYGNRRKHGGWAIELA